MTIAWVVGAAVIFFASFVMGLTGFGIAIVAMAFLPWLMSPVTAVVLLTLYACAFLLFITIQLRRETNPRAIGDLLIGTLVGVPFGVWSLSALSVSMLNRLLGLLLVLVVALEVVGRLPTQLTGRGWGLGAGFASGLIGGAIGTSAPPVVVYASTRGWAPRTMKANVTLFLLVNQLAILTGYWWTGLLTWEVLMLAASYAAPGLAGAALGVLLFERIDALRFRRVVFALLLVSGLLLLVRG